MVQLSNFANACIHQLSQGRGGMKLLADNALGLSVGLKILLMDEQFALCNIIIRVKELVHRQLLQIHQNFKENNSICIDELLWCGIKG
jgi:ABC-type nitrate/sulfonate/bicarbonate transport system ATPase subunit